MSTIQTDYAGLRRLAKELLDALPSATLEEAASGLKCFQLAYLGMKEGSAIEMHEAPFLFVIITRAAIKAHPALLHENISSLEVCDEREG